MSDSVVRAGHSYQFVLGLGAQKAGTSWLHHYLVESGAFAEGHLKEFHVWDGLETRHFRYHRVRRFHRPSKELRLRRKLQQSPVNYFEYFSELVRCSADDQWMTGDITPSYAALNARSLRKIRILGARAGFDVVPVFIMRDPVERCWSAFRMNLDSRRRQEIARPTSSIASDFIRYVESEPARVRSCYHHTLDALVEAFGREVPVVAIYEDLFYGDGLSGLSSRLGVEVNPRLLGSRVNSSVADAAIGDDVFAEAARRLAVTYHGVSCTYPEVVDLWPGFRWL